MDLETYADYFNKPPVPTSNDIWRSLEYLSELREKKLENERRQSALQLVRRYASAQTPEEKKSALIELSAIDPNTFATIQEMEAKEKVAREAEETGKVTRARESANTMQLLNTIKSNVFTQMPEDYESAKAYWNQTAGPLAVMYDKLFPDDSTPEGQAINGAIGILNKWSRMYDPEDHKIALELKRGVLQGIQAESEAKGQTYSKKGFGVAPQGSAVFDLETGRKAFEVPFTGGAYGAGGGGGQSLGEIKFREMLQDRLSKLRTNTAKILSNLNDKDSLLDLAMELGVTPSREEAQKLSLEDLEQLVLQAAVDREGQLVQDIVRFGGTAQPRLYDLIQRKLNKGKGALTQKQGSEGIPKSEIDELVRFMNERRKQYLEKEEEQRRRAEDLINRQSGSVLRPTHGGGGGW